MRITLFLLVVSILQTLANDSYSQKTRLSLDFTNTKLVDALDKMEELSEFYFLYNEKLINTDREVSLSVENTRIDEILNKLFAGTDVVYTIADRKIILAPSFLSENQQQQKSVSGKVTDTGGQPLPGVTVVVKGTTQGTVTNGDGEYSLLTIPANATLVFSFVGMKMQEITVGNQTSINITLQEETVGVEEVVIIGYGIQKKVNLTGAVDVIKGDDLADRQAPTVSQLLQGLSAGTNFSITNRDGFQPGATMAVTIRGIGSLNGGSPFVLINGIPGDMNNLNPSDIESVSVLKDAAASAIYGARAAYGVILITTKKGEESEKMSVTYTGNVALNTPPPLPKSLDSYTWVRVINEAGDNRGGHPFKNEQVDRIIAYQNQDWDFLRQTFAPGQTVFGMIAQGNSWNADLAYADTDWWDIYYGNSVNQKHDISLKGGTKNASYYFAAGYYGQEGVLNYGTDKFQRINILGQVDIAIADWWDFNWAPRLSNNYRERPNMGWDYSYMFREIGRTYPFVPLYDGGGEYSNESKIPYVLGLGTDKWDGIDSWNNFKTEIRPVKGWKINADFAYNYYQGIRTRVKKNLKNHNVDGSWTIPTGAINYLDRSHYNNFYWNSNIYSSYNLDIKNIHNFYIMAGMQLEKGRNSELGAYKPNLIVESVPSFQTATGDVILTERLSHRALAGYFSRFSYNYKEKYLLETNVRYDGSYVFREGNRWGFFPSFSLGWNVNKEPFWTNMEKHINTLKVRASWGSLGNQNVSPYSDLELLRLQTGKLPWIFNFGEKQPIGYTSAPYIVNKNLTWETATTKNLGVDMSFLNNRLTAQLELYERNTTDMVGPQQALPGVLGASVPRANNSTLRTRGWDLTLDWKQNFENGFSYFMNLNLSDYKSTVTKYFNPTGTLSTWYEGRDVGEIWGYTVYDLFRTQEELDNYRASVDLSRLGSSWMTGDVKYEDTNKDGKVNNGSYTINDHGDISVIGNDQPRYIYGFNAGASFKGFDFSMLWRGVGKKELYFNRSSTIFWGFNHGWWESTLQPRNLDYFRDKPGTKYSGLYEGDANINTDAYWPRPYLSGSDEVKNKNNPNTRYLQDASYLRLQNIQVGYSLPQSLVSRLKMQKLRIGFSGENLLTFTKIPDGIDPVAPSGFLWGDPNVLGRLTYGADRTYSLLLTITY